MYKFYSLVALSLLISKAHASSNVFENMRAHMEKMEQHLKQVMQDFDQEMEKDKASFSNLDAKEMSMAIDYDDAEKVVITITMPEGTLKEVEAEAFEKQKTATIKVPQESGQTVLTIDRRGVQLSSKQKVEKKTKKDDKDEAVAVSYSTQSSYQSFQVPIEAQKAEVKVKGDSLIITLPRESKKKKIEVTREEA